MRWKPRIDYLIDLQRPVVRYRQWRFAILKVNGKPCGKPIPFTTLRETMRRARALYHRQLGREADRPGEGAGADESLLLLVEDLRPVSSGPVSGVVALHCPEDECGHFLHEVNRDRLTDPVLPARHKKHWVGGVVSLRPTRLPPGEFPDFERLIQSAEYFTVHTKCSHCGTRAEWDLPRMTSWARYRRTRTA